VPLVLVSSSYYLYVQCMFILNCVVIFAFVFLPSVLCVINICTTSILQYMKHLSTVLLLYSDVAPGKKAATATAGAVLSSTAATKPPGGDREKEGAYRLMSFIFLLRHANVAPPQFIVILASMCLLYCSTCSINVRSYCSILASR
jgi:hypothetical protein